MTKPTSSVFVFVLALTALCSDVTAMTDQHKQLFKDLFRTREGCWVPSKPRGGGILPTCPSGEELEHRLCYPDCKPGYHGRGPMCFPDDLSYSRGDGHLPGNGGCEEGTELDVINCYTKCKPGYHGRGSRCWTDLSAYGRTAGDRPKYCDKDDKEYEHGLCYNKCPESYKGMLEKCYLKECPKKYPYKCGLVCMQDKLQCGLMITEAIANGIAIPLTLGLGLITSALSPTINVIRLFAHWKDCVYTE